MSTNSVSSTPSTAGFRQFPLAAVLQRGIEAAGFTEPWPVQLQAIPAALAGRDVLGLAQTGTGKTAAFALPILQQLLAGRGPGPRALVVAPTRELAMQIQADIETLARFTHLRAVTVFGGVAASRQIRALRERPDIVVACPGRLLDLMGQGAVRLDSVQVLVLDEADHMFDMGFLPDVRRILAALPAERQNLLFSATMPAPIRKLSDRVLRRPKVVELAHTTPLATIEHALYPVPSTRKLDLLQHLLADEGFTSAIVFSRTKHRAKKIAQQLDSLGHEAVALQGNMSQPQRDRAMGGFRSGRFDVLVATDIAARGIDVARVSHVINFDVPTTPDAYTHRIGRTGRAERSGKAYTFVCADDRAAVRDIERHLGVTIPRRHVAGFEGKDLPTEKTTRRPARPARPQRTSSHPAVPEAQPKPRQSRPARGPRRPKGRSPGPQGARSHRGRNRSRRPARSSR